MCKKLKNLYIKYKILEYGQVFSSSIKTESDFKSKIYVLNLK